MKRVEGGWVKTTKAIEGEHGVRVVAISNEGNVALGHDEDGQVTHTHIIDL